MSIKESDLEVDKCYAAGKQVRKVLQLGNTTVKYQWRGPLNTDRWGSKVTVLKSRFIEDLEREVAEDTNLVEPPPPPAEPENAEAATTAEADSGGEGGGDQAEGGEPKAV